MFQIKDFASIVASMINRMRATQSAITDFTVGSVARTMIEAPAIEIDELYQQMFNGLTDAIPVSIYRAFEFTRIPASPASGVIRVTISPAAAQIVIPAGTVFSSTASQSRFKSAADAVIPPGQTMVDVYVAATSSGVASNAVAALSWTMSPSVSGLVSATNPLAFSNGADDEKDAEMRLRFSDYVKALNHGTVDALKYGIKTVRLMDVTGAAIERVIYANVHEPWLTNNALDASVVDIYVHNGSSGASAGLLTLARNVIAGYRNADGSVVVGWKAAGTTVNVLAASSLLVPVAGALTVSGGFVFASVSAAVQAAIAKYLTGLDVGEKALQAEVVAIAMGVDGVYNFVASAPMADVAPTYSQKVMPGAFAITAGS